MMHCNQKGGILADDMGLGKTLLTTMFLSGLFQSNLIERVLIIVKPSLLKIWKDELKKAGLERNVHVFENKDKNSINTVLENGGVLLTTYETYQRNCNALMAPDGQRWCYAILDEAHKFKNRKTKLAVSIKKIQSRRRLLVTGTPMQKDLMDLFSLFEFVDPDILGKATAFHEKYVLPTQQGRYANAERKDREQYLDTLQRLRELTRPYMLRRGKKVLIENGDLSCKKNDIVVWLRLTPVQISMYKQLYKPKPGFLDRKTEPSFSLVGVSQEICNYPALLLKENDGSTSASISSTLVNELNLEESTYQNTENSCKIKFIQDLVKEIFAEGREEEAKDKNARVRKVLIFCQHLDMLDAVQDALNSTVEGGIIRLDGTISGKQREALIEKFDSDNTIRIFLLSAKVGGEGLTLTAATRVIIVEPSWSYSDENQIADRVYRLGQDKNVFIYRLVTCNTVEDHSYKTQMLKGALAKAMTEGQLSISSIKKQDGKVLKVPDEGFAFSVTQKFLERTIGNQFEFGKRHLEFLTNHCLVGGLTDQNLVLSKVERTRSDVSQEQSSDSETSNSVTDFLRDIEMETAEVSTSCRYLSSKSNILLKEQNVESCGTGQMTKNKTPEKFLKTSNSVAGDSDKVDMFVSVPHDMIGLIIGKGGQNVKRMETNSGAKIWKTSTKGEFKLSGTFEQVSTANGLILEKIEQHKTVNHSFVKQQSSSQNAPLQPAVRHSMYYGERGSGNLWAGPSRGSVPGPGVIPRATCPPRPNNQWQTPGPKEAPGEGRLPSKQYATNDWPYGAGPNGNVPLPQQSALYAEHLPEQAQTNVNYLCSGGSAANPSYGSSSSHSGYGAAPVATQAGYTQQALQVGRSPLPYGENAVYPGAAAYPRYGSIHSSGYFASATTGGYGGQARYAPLPTAGQPPMQAAGQPPLPAAGQPSYAFGPAASYARAAAAGQPAYGHAGYGQNSANPPSYSRFAGRGL